MSLRKTKSIAIIGGGPSGLMAAEYLSKKEFHVTLYDRKKTIGRKFLLAGRGGLNLTHSDPPPSFLKKYGPAQEMATRWLADFSPDDMRTWAAGLGEETFTGSSGRVFPKSFKASPLLRAWLKRLDHQGVKFDLGKRWMGGTELQAEKGQIEHINADAILLALGGASWPHLGADGSWMEMMRSEKIACSPLRPANCGFTIAWSDIFRNKFSGQHLKSINLIFKDQKISGEVMIDRNGIEGGAIYALSRFIRDEIASSGSAQLKIDLRPTLDLGQIVQKLSTPRGTKSFSTYLQSSLGLSPVGINLLYEHDLKCGDYSSEKLAALVKNLPLTLTAAFPIDRAISTAGGIQLDQIDDQMMIKNHAGWFVAGEMLDWEAPTGGYLLQACLSSGITAAKGIENYLSRD